MIKNIIKDLDSFQSSYVGAYSYSVSNGNFKHFPRKNRAQISILFEKAIYLCRTFLRNLKYEKNYSLNEYFSPVACVNGPVTLISCLVEI